VRRRKKDRHAFRTTSLLNIATTAPYGHSGAFSRLSDVIRDHLNPRASVAQYDFSRASYPQFHEQNIFYPKAKLATLQALANLSSRLVITAALVPDDLVNELVAFLRTLSDPGLATTACLAPWWPDENSVAPDGQRLRALLA
jgi:cytochrome c peroxidase